MSVRPRIYVAGKYSAPTPEQRLANTERAIEVGIHLWRKGYAPFIPHLSHFTDELANRLGLPIQYREWLEWDDCFQETCAAFFYDSQSSGADREHRNAKVLGQPIFRFLEDVPLASDLLIQFRNRNEDVADYDRVGHYKQQVMIQRLPHAEGLPLPDYQTAGAAGMDLCAATPEGEQLALYPGEQTKVPTGYAVALPAGCAGLVLPRSGLATKRKITLANTPGLVDCDFRGELMIALYNYGEEVFNFTRGDRLAQFVLVDVNRAVWTLVPALPETERGKGGFGSTGLATN